MLIWRLWRWFADKFDQRDRPDLAPLLAAADEVAWSVHVEAVRGAQARGLAPALVPAPLPFLDAVAAPEAVPRDEPPPDLRDGGDDRWLGPLIARLPVPVVSLPLTAQWAPWSLVALGHEVGHHLEHDLAAELRLVAHVGARAAAAYSAAPVASLDVDPWEQEEEEGRWRTWSHELFADLVGLASMGPAAFAALLPYEVGTEQRMLDRGRGRYPAPAVRLAASVEAGRRLGLDLDPVLGGLDLAGLVSARPDDPLAGARAAVRADLAVARRLAAALVDDGLLGLGPVATLFGFSTADFAAAGPVELRADELLAGTPPGGGGSPRAVREVASAGFAAWVRLSSGAEAGLPAWSAAPAGTSRPAAGGRPDRQADRQPDRSAADRLAADRLAAHLVDTIVANREDGLRAAPAAAAVELDGELAEALMREVR
jgi:hypothetical protein